MTTHKCLLSECCISSRHPLATRGGLEIGQRYSYSRIGTSATKGLASNAAAPYIAPAFEIAGWSSLVARQAHNLKVAGSNPAPATNFAAGAVQTVPYLPAKNRNSEGCRPHCKNIAAWNFGSMVEIKPRIVCRSL